MGIHEEIKKCDEATRGHIHADFTYHDKGVSMNCDIKATTYAMLQLGAHIIAEVSDGESDEYMANVMTELLILAVDIRRNQ